MKGTKGLNRFLTLTLLALGAVVLVTSAGCTVNTCGMTLPTPFYHESRVHYFPRGSEFPFPNEAANLQESQPDFHEQH
ncbi:MAG: hypothetical protein LBT46_15685 [Planctomycetaceae bacterium]|jgi:hypothetical protein|nr:hypothetical protein [Planctomycetaceae bacterium]